MRVIMRQGYTFRMPSPGTVEVEGPDRPGKPVVWQNQPVYELSTLATWAEGWLAGKDRGWGAVI